MISTLAVTTLGVIFTPQRHAQNAGEHSEIMAAVTPFAKTVRLKNRGFRMAAIKKITEVGNEYI